VTRRVATSIIIAATALIAGVSGIADAAGATTLTDPPATVSVPTSVGSTIVIRLTTCTSCGDSWHLVSGPAAAVVRLESVTQVAQPHKAGTVGFPFWTVYRYLAEGAGTTTSVARETGPTGSLIRSERVTFHVSAPAAASTSTPSLPFTGAPTGWLALAAAGLLIAGSGLVLASRRQPAA
jgi:LPXTG-motif cell wall-anchored protein